MSNRASEDAHQTHENALAQLNDDVIRLLVENHKRFQSFLSKRVGSEADAEEILQQSFSRAIEKPPSNASEQSILAWFFRVLRNALIDHYRAKGTDDRKLRELATSLQEPSAETEICECLNRLLPTLKKEYSEVLRSVDLEGHSLDQVASQLGLTRNALDVRLHRARKALKTSLIRACGTCTKHGCLNCTCQ